MKYGVFLCILLGFGTQGATAARRKDSVEVGRKASAQAASDDADEDLCALGVGTLLTVNVVGDDFCDVTGGEGPTQQHPRLCAAGALKPRRPTPYIMRKELKDLSGSFPGLLNGWPAFENLVLESLLCDQSMFGGPDQIWPDDGADSPGDALEAHTTCKKTYAKFQLPPWMLCGWAPDSPVFLFWFTPGALTPSGDAKLRVGTRVLAESGDLMVKSASLVSHRYANDNSWKGKLTYHESVLLEWVTAGGEPVQHVTLIELAWLNGLGGYGGKSNWYADKNEKETEIFKAMREQMPTMVQPWDSSRAEVRFLDLPLADLAALKEYMARYTEGPGVEDARFVEITFPGERTPVKFMSQNGVFQAILKYMQKERVYDEKRRNCQTFATDLWQYLTGKEMGVVTTVLKPFYTPKLKNFES